MCECRRRRARLCAAVTPRSAPRGGREGGSKRGGGGGRRRGGGGNCASPSSGNSRGGRPRRVVRAASRGALRPPRRSRHRREEEGGAGESREAPPARETGRVSPDAAGGGAGGKGREGQDRAGRGGRAASKTPRRGAGGKRGERRPRALRPDTAEGAGWSREGQAPVPRRREGPGEGTFRGCPRAPRGGRRRPRGPAAAPAGPAAPLRRRAPLTTATALPRNGGGGRIYMCELTRRRGIPPRVNRPRGCQSGPAGVVFRRGWTLPRRAALGTGHRLPPCSASEQLPARSGPCSRARPCGCAAGGWVWTSQEFFRLGGSTGGALSAAGCAGRGGLGQGRGLCPCPCGAGGAAKGPPLRGTGATRSSGLVPETWF